MALVLDDRVQETTTTTGTGTLTLAGAVLGYQSFAAIGNGNTTYYCITDGTSWETGIGTYTSSGTTLARTTVLDSSNAGSLVNFSAGTKNVFVTYPGSQAVWTTGSGTIYTSASARGGRLLDAWVVFDGTLASPTVISGFNVSSISKVSTGLYDINFTTAFPSSNYVFVGNSQFGNTIIAVSSTSTTSTRIQSYNAVTAAVRDTKVYAMFVE